MLSVIRNCRLFFVFLFFASFSIQSQEYEYLKTQDVNKVMQQIFSQHVDKKQMTASILKNSFKVYIDQFDPDRIYLLDSEVEPFLQLSDADMQRIMEQYQRGEFPEYTQLNNVIQLAIKRARAIRSELETKDKSQIVDKSKKLNPDGYEDWSDPDLKQTFAKTPEELKTRIKQNMILFIAEERNRYGTTQVTKYENQLFNFYDRRSRNKENSYLFFTDNDKQMPQTEKENIFVMHILKSLASSLDAHTTFFSSNEAYDMKVRLEKEIQGIGVVLKQAPEGGFVVTRLLDGSPAAKSGLVKVSDRIVEIDGKSISDESYDRVMELLHGKSGTKVSLMVQRAVDEGNKKIDKVFNIQLNRAPIVVNEDRVDITYQTFGNGIIGIVTLHSFYQSDDGISSVKDLQEAIKSLDKKGNLRGLILDLRENSGGFLSQAVKVAGLFITNGVVVISKYFNGEEHVYRDIDGKATYDGPLIILTSKATASAAEIVAQALQDYGVALIVGDEHTYGKGTIQSQTVTENQGSSYFKVTVGKYYTVSGKTPQIRGVKADVIVPSQFAHENIGEEYLEFSLKPDTIPAAYDDPLSDIDANLKSWYMRYYTPHLQHQVLTWKNMLPVLKKNSEYRIVHNKNYQMFLNKGTANEKKEKKEKNQKSFGADDLQLSEAVNIMKDMIILQSRMHEAHMSENNSLTNTLQPAGVSE